MGRKNTKVPNELLTIDDLIEILGVGRCTAYNIAHDPKYGGIKIASSWRIPRASVDLILKKGIEKKTSR